MFPHNHSLNGIGPKPSAAGAHILTSGESVRNLTDSGSELAFQNLPLCSSIQSPMSRPAVHTTQWMSTNQMGMSSKPWQGRTHHQPPEHYQDSHKPMKAAQQDDYKHREYLKQQQRLKAMQLSSNKPGVTAEALIGNLLEKKDTFTPKPHAPTKSSTDSSGALKSNLLVCSGVSNTNGNASVNAQAYEDLPVWLNPSSTRLPTIYSHIWSLVCDPASGGKFVDTNKILALLLTSSLPKEVLGFIWNVATNGTNNQLNQQQLYITLALVALAQMGFTFNNLSVLNLMPQPPIPSFNMNIPKVDREERPKHFNPIVESISSNVPQPTYPSNDVPSGNSTLSNLPTALPALNPVTLPPSASSVDDDFGEFTDYQSAEVISVQPELGLSAVNSLPSTAVLQPTMTARQVMTELNHSVVTKLSGSHGRSIGSRLANYSLGAPRSQNHPHKQKRSSVEHDNLYLDDDDVAVVCGSNEQPKQQHFQPHECVESDDFSDFQIASGLNLNVDELFPKCNPKLQKQKVVLKESAIRTESDEEEPKSGGKFGDLLSLDSSSSVAKISSKDVPILPLPEKPTKELMSVEEDKYSALRFIDIETESAALRAAENAMINEPDEFGDFVTADDLFIEIAVRDTVNHSNPVKCDQEVDWQNTQPQTIEFSVSEWESPAEQYPTPLPKDASLLNASLLNGAPSAADLLESALSSLDISKNTNATKTEDTSKWSFDLDLDVGVKSTHNKSNIEEDEEFGDFVGPEVLEAENVGKPTSGFVNDQSWVEDSSSKVEVGPGLSSDNRSVSSLELPVAALSRHGSLPSLDLNIFSVTDDPHEKICNLQVVDWIKCLESGLSLIQAAATTFSSISPQSVLMEVLGAPKGRAYLNNLLEAHRVTWRIQKSFQRSGQGSVQAESLIVSINGSWSSLKPFYMLTNIETDVEKDGSDEESGQPICGVCGSPASRGVLEYGGHAYHAPCANLWVNCVDRTLPVHSL